MPYQALRDRVILKRVEKAKDVKSPFITPEVAKERPQECEVVGVSDGYTSDFGVRFFPPVAVGDKVLIGKYSGSEHKVDGEDLLFVRWDEILAVEPRPNTGLVISDSLMSAEEALQTSPTYGGTIRRPISGMNAYAPPLNAELATKEEVSAKLRASIEHALIPSEETKVAFRPFIAEPDEIEVKPQPAAPVAASVSTPLTEIDGDDIPF